MFVEAGRHEDPDQRHLPFVGGLDQIGELFLSNEVGRKEVGADKENADAGGGEGVVDLLPPSLARLDLAVPP
ncbi:MAG TPA: hypothetical protein VE078_07490, partial [Thermoanaerobaculia bacterium]|nr:hypothetical protein [Thermoanaerobaculia bacterium]